MSDITIGIGCRVTLHFSLQLHDGEVIDSTFDKQPATLIIGDGNLPHGFEQVIFGMKQGNKGVFSIPPERAFGLSNHSNKQTFSRQQFSHIIQLEKGMIVNFSDVNNHEVVGVVRSFDDQSVLIDFNHPLAGKALLFQVEIIKVERIYENMVS